MNFQEFFLRPIIPEDCDILYRWRNAPKVRRVSLNPEEIPYDDHCRWFEKQLSGRGRTNLIFGRDNVSLGVVHFEIDEKNGVADSGFYKGYDNSAENIGLQLEVSTLDFAFKNLGLRKLTGKVLSNNKKIIKFHEVFGYEVEGCQKQQIVRDDKFLDIYFLAIFAERWSQRRPSLEWMF